MRRHIALVALATATLLPLPHVAHAAPGEPAGSTVKVVNQVTAELDRETRTLATGDGVNQEELIAVGTDAIGELKLLDDTKLALGPGSRLRLDKFVYDPGKSKGAVILNLVKGTFRFITGAAEKPAYVVKTPGAAITVRGTIFDVFIEESGLTWVLLHEGALTVCNTRGKCRDLDEPGRLIRVTDDGAVGIPVRWAGLPGAGSVPFDTAFPFVGAPPSIDPTPILTRDAILSTEPDQPKKPRRASTPDTPGKTRETKTEEPRRGGKTKTKTVVIDNPPQIEVKPTKKPKTVVVIKPEKEPKPKKRVTFQQDEGVKIMNGMDIAIGMGGGIRFGGKGRNTGGDMGTKMPNRSMDTK